MAGGGTATAGLYTLGAVQPHVRSAANAIGPKFGIKSIGGFGYRPNKTDHDDGLALDFMTYDGQALADYVVANADAYGVTYVIWNRQIWNPSQGWHRYTGPNPHTDHVHVSFSPSPGSADPNTPQIDVPGPWNADVPAQFVPMMNALEWLGDSHNWLRIGFVAGGGVIILLFVAKTAKGTLANV